VEGQGQLDFLQGAVVALLQTLGSLVSVYEADQIQNKDAVAHLLAVTTSHENAFLRLHMDSLAYERRSKDSARSSHGLIESLEVYLMGLTLTLTLTLTLILTLTPMIVSVKDSYRGREEPRCSMAGR